VLGTATSAPEELGPAYLKVFEELGVGNTDFLPLSTREEANAEATLDALRAATAVYFTGGDQLRITSIIGGSRVDVLLHEAYERDGLILGGTSAGAAMMSSTMVLGGSDTVPSTSAVRLGPGLEFLPGVVIDMHFAERGRLSRLLAAVARFPHDLGVGIDEDTALVVDDDRFEVIGSGAVTIVDAGEATSIFVPEDEGPIALTGAKIHVLPAGYRFDMRARSPEVTGTRDDGQASPS
jgi:cyanophycinase